MRVLPCLWLISSSWLRWRLSRPALLMLLSSCRDRQHLLAGTKWQSCAATHEGGAVSGAGRTVGMRARRAPGGTALQMRLRQDHHCLRRPLARAQDVSYGCWREEQKRQQYSDQPRDDGGKWISKRF